ncbi:acetyl-CoA carboxylase biotin carboxylase subunit [Alteribacter natronophilus]|uniref:acetyl-CoA carboxylase biotin carboxylase subunit n=1 Tax=Alteribacter natronophilus TaxID=2583810 RepID=UPI00110DB341|nr:biotin carboxylase N-terminal domain-containing protein [Alteribacter natronophilus]TMW70267.1 ATP-grasp domain-containing protein [Alteribacter natronophilus]
MIKKLLVANRGEIAVRIFRTCERLGIRTVAVFSDADEEAVHTKAADEARWIGPARVKESYLNADKILEVAKETGADAIHPGYGFLSENPDFSRRVKEAGITFIGPAENIMETMGNKIAAREAMIEAGVPVVPGATLKSENEDEVAKVCAEIGYPVMIKAASGGGGIGMQRVDHKDELVKVLPSVIKKAETFFGSAELYVEKFIENPRHIEAQVFGDHHGNVVCLGERDCSIQRRNQKIIEEAPAPKLSDETRKSLFAYAEKAAGNIGYTNAGTIEFLVDSDENIYFLEMNTRLQVEHPVTEEVTGIDLVEWQIRIAEEKRISDLEERNMSYEHAIEVRVYAEDPVTFFPSPGKLKRWSFPQMEDIRYDSGVEEGVQVTPFYDPMLAKIIAKGSSRQDAIEKMSACLEKAEVEGIKTNIPMLIETLQHDVFKEGSATTQFVQQYVIEKSSKV